MSMFRFSFFHRVAPCVIYTLSLHDALPISLGHSRVDGAVADPFGRASGTNAAAGGGADPCILAAVLHGRSQRNTAADRKSTRLNSSHEWISYAVFCLKKKRNKQDITNARQ